MNKITHAIITYSGAHFLITQNQFDELMGKTRDDFIELEGSPVPVKSIDIPLTIEKYYETFPNRRPPIIDQYKNVPGMGFGGLIQTSREKALKGIISGLKNFLSDKAENECRNARELLALAEKRLMQIN